MSIKKPLVSIVIPTFNRQNELLRLLKSISESDYPSESLEVIIVDNSQDAQLASEVRVAYEGAQVLTPDKNLFSNGARRLGSEVARGSYIFLLDDDNVLETDCITKLVEAMEANSSFGAVGPMMLDGASNIVWSAGGRVSTFGLPHYIFGGQSIDTLTPGEIIHDIDYFPNACLVRRSLIKKVPLDDSAFPHNWAETDFCLRIIAAGYEVVCVTAAIDRHFIGYKGFLTRLGIDKTYDQAKSRILFRRRHLPKLVDWLRFWLIIFPVSTAVYVWRIVKTPDNKAKILAAYIRGTYDGLLQPLQPLP